MSAKLVSISKKQNVIKRLKAFAVLTFTSLFVPGMQYEAAAQGHPEGPIGVDTSGNPVYSSHFL